MGEGDFGRSAHFEHVHAVHFHARNAERRAAAVEAGFGGRALGRGAHCVLVVLDH